MVRFLHESGTNHLSFNPKNSCWHPNTTRQQHSTKVASYIASLTPLQTSFRNPNFEITFMGDLTPIFLKEMPPSDFFFSKKRKAIVKIEYHQKDGVVNKRQRLVYEENDEDGPQFAKEVAGSLSDFSTVNQWSVENLIEQMRHKFLLVEHLQS
jgi:hypothetical protein